ncbi:hypothetical protein TWF718_005971 [Orbilia javanica]|uniref:Uncharacterized protein n=1 Tax=Orbilia javanica TaxID=47235 RepID=A0AAN8RJU5_9PEZI
MKYSPAGRRLSLPAFDTFGQPMFEPYLYYAQFHPYPPPPPPPLPPHLHQHQHQFSHPHPHHGYQHPLEPYPYFNVPETHPEEYFIPSSPDSNPFPNTPIVHYNISREISPDSVSSSIDCTNSLSSFCPQSKPSHSSSSSFSPFSSASSPPSSSPPNSFPFAISIHPFDVSRTETPGEYHHYATETDKMVVRTIPHPDTIQEKYDGPHPRRRHSVAKHQQQAGSRRALVVNGSTNDPVPSKASKKAPAAMVVSERNDKAKGQYTKPQEILSPQPKSQPAPILIQASVDQPKPAVLDKGSIKEVPPSNLADGEEQSAYVHLTLNHLPHTNKLNTIRLRANYTATANKAKLIEEARSIFTTALRSHEPTKGVELGSWFSWTERGVNINFKTNAHRWIATENTDWLSDIGEGIRFNEKWGGIVVRDIWNPYILENALPEDNDLKRKLEQLNVLSYDVDNDTEPVKEAYRIRKIRWFGPSTLAIWFHDITVAEYFAQKGVWFMEGLVGVGKNKKVGVCGLPTVYPLIEQNRNRMAPRTVRRNGFVHAPTHKEGHGGQHGRNSGEAKGSKLGSQQRY